MRSCVELNCWTPELVVAALEAAMRTMRALPDRGHSTRLAQIRIELPADCSLSEPSDGRLKPPVPKPGEIDQMDQVLRWVLLIPQHRFVLRRIVLFRSQTSFATQRPMAWKAVARAVNADPNAVKEWYASAIEIIVRRLNADRIAPR